MSLAPAWLRDQELGLCPCGCVGRRRKVDFIDKTIVGATSVMRRALAEDETAQADGLLQRLDTRVAIIGAFAGLLAISFLHRTLTLALVYAAVLGIACASKVAVGAFVRRVWLFVPIFTGIVALPLALNVVRPGHVVVPLGTYFGHRLGLTHEGLDTAARIVLRTATSASVVILITITTPWTKLLAALRSLHVPRMFVLILGMAYRYVFVLLATVDDMYTARKARVVRADRSSASARTFVASTAGVLFGKAHALSDEVHMAMVARGYRGDARMLAAPRIAVADGLALVVVAVSCFALVGLDRMFG